MAGILNAGRQAVHVIRPWLTALLEGAKEAGAVVTTYEGVQQLIQENIKNAPEDIKNAMRTGNSEQIKYANQLTLEDWLGSQVPGTVHGNKRTINDVNQPIETQPSHAIS